MQGKTKKPNRFARQRLAEEQTLCKIDKNDPSSAEDIGDDYLKPIDQIVVETILHKKPADVPKVSELMEDERQKGLANPLPSSNIGFKLLQKFGYSEGEGLGKDGQGIIEPLKVEKRPNKDFSGLGILERKRKRQEMSRRNEEELKDLREKLKQQFKTNLKELHQQ